MAQLGTPTYRIASISGNGTGAEVLSAGIEVLTTLAWVLGEFRFEFDHLEWDTDSLRKHGKHIPDDGLETLKQYDAILFGAIGTSGQSVLRSSNTTPLRKLKHCLIDVSDHVALSAFHLEICQPLQQYASVHSIRALRGISSPLKSDQHRDIDWVIIRENSEGEYAGHGGRSHVGQPWEVATEVAVFTRHGVQRLMRFAFETARKRARNRITVVTKQSAHRSGFALWDEVAATTAQEYPDLEWDTMAVEMITSRMLLHPSSLDTIVATNLHADILSNLATTLAGSTPISASSTLDPTRQNPSLFQPTPPSPPLKYKNKKIDSKGLPPPPPANPIPTICAYAEMVRWLGHHDAAESLLECVQTVLSDDTGTEKPDPAASASKVAAAVCAEVERELGYAIVPYSALLRRRIKLEEARRKLGF